MISDYARRTEKFIEHSISDLEACCDRNLPNVGGIVEESIWENREAMNVITKLLPRVEHHIETGNGLSEETHG